MGLAIFYDPCFKCEHRDTKSMCNMCELTYHRNQHMHNNIDAYVEEKFEDVETKLGEEYEQGTSKT